MVESEAKELSEDQMLGAVLYGHAQQQVVIDAINEFGDFWFLPPFGPKAARGVRHRHRPINTHPRRAGGLQAGPTRSQPRRETP